MKSKYVLSLILILHIIFFLYLVILSDVSAKTTKSHGSSTVLPTSVALHTSVTHGTQNQIFGQVADNFDFEEMLSDWDSFNTNNSREMIGKNSVHIQCEADHNVNFFTVDDENGKKFDKLIAQMAADVINNNFSMDSDNWRNASLVMEMSLLLPVTLEKYAVCVSHCNRLDEACKFADLDYNIEDIDISNRMSKVMSLSLNVSNKTVDCSGFSDYFRAQDAQIDILTWDDQIVRSHDVMRYMEKGSVRIYGIFDLDEILKAKGVRCTLQFQKYRNIEMDWYLFICLAAIPSVFICVAFSCFLQRIFHIFSMNDNSCDHGKISSEDVEEGKIKGGGYNGSQKNGEAKSNLQILEIQNSKSGYLDVEAKVALKQPPPFSGALKGNKVHVKIYRKEINKKQAISLEIARPLIEHGKREMLGGRDHADSVLGSSANVGANRTE